jgi:membrane protein required for colicin V production
MTAFDYAVLAVIAASVLLGLWRGVVSEILALAAWVVAFFVARAVAAEVANWLAGQIAEPGAAAGGGVCAGFCRCPAGFRIARLLISLLLKAAGLGLLDRLLGGFWRLARSSGGAGGGAGGGDDALAQADWWRDAMLAPPLETVVIAAKPWLPAMRQNGFGTDRGFGFPSLFRGEGGDN